MKRRTLLRTAGGIGAASILGGGYLKYADNDVAAASIQIDAENPDVVSNDRGDLTQVTINPQFTVKWNNLDDGVAKVFYLIEAKVGDGDWMPLFRATPWLDPTTTTDSFKKMVPGTTGMYRMKQPLEMVLNSDPRFDDGEGPDESAGPLIVADDDGAPAYQSADWTQYSPGDYSSYVVTGTSMGSATEAETFLVDDQGLVLQNNYPDVNAGYYGAAADTIPFDNPTDGTLKSTTVQLRYTVELQRPNMGWAQYVLDDYTLSTPEEAASQLDAFIAEDIDEGNSKIVMNGEDGYHEFPTPTGVTYRQLRMNDAHPGVMVATTSFQVDVRNEGSTNNVTGSSGASSE